MQLARDWESGMLGINRMLVSVPEATLAGVEERGWGSACRIEGVQAYANAPRISAD